MNFTCVLGVRYNSPTEYAPSGPDPKTPRTCRVEAEFVGTTSSVLHRVVLSCNLGGTLTSCVKQFTPPPYTKLVKVYQPPSMLGDIEECAGCISTAGFPKANIVTNSVGEAIGVLVEYRHHCLKSPRQDLVCNRK